ncbi:hypothetical protein [Benzoatithermus flavus]|uniref:Flagellar assembly protein FliH n=1 Tax=Benzoatithermus flavus TaxID=3108223 RepID=A0ABU8XXA1_9PROT
MPQPFPFTRDFDRLPPQSAAKPTEKAGAEERAARRQAALERARAELERKLADARRQGHEEGFAKGVAEGRAAAEQDLAGEALRLARAFADAVLPLQAAMEEQVARVVAEAGSFVAQAVAKLLPGLEAQLGSLRLERFVEEALRSAPRASSIVLSVAPDACERTRMALTRLAPAIGSTARVEIRPDPTLAAGTLQVSWEQGGIALSPASLARSILDACRILAGEAELPSPEAAAAPGPAEPLRRTPRRRKPANPETSS